MDLTASTGTRLWTAWRPCPSEPCACTHALTRMLVQTPTEALHAGMHLQCAGAVTQSVPG